MRLFLSLNPSRLRGWTLSRQPSPASFLSGAFSSTFSGPSSTLLSRSLLAQSQSKQLWQSDAINHNREVSVDNLRWKSGLQDWGGRVLRRMLACASNRTRPSRARLKVDWVYWNATCRSRVRPPPRRFVGQISCGYRKSAATMLRVRASAGIVFMGTWRQIGETVMDPVKIGVAMVLRYVLVMFVQVRQRWVPCLAENHGGAVRRRSWLRFPQTWCKVCRSVSRPKVYGLKSCQKLKLVGRISTTWTHMWTQLMDSNLLGFRIWDPGDFDNAIELSGVVPKDNSKYSAKHEVKKEGNTGHCTVGTTKTSCLSIDGSGWVHRVYSKAVLADLFSKLKNNPRMLSGFVSNFVANLYLVAMLA